MTWNNGGVFGGRRVERWMDSRTDECMGECTNGVMRTVFSSSSWPMASAAGLGEAVADEHFLHGGVPCQLPALWLVGLVWVLPHLWTGRWAPQTFSGIFTQQRITTESYGRQRECIGTWIYIQYMHAYCTFGDTLFEGVCKRVTWTCY